jgi:two-component system, chemotaxis family, chemotaxis protein CheY
VKKTVIVVEDELDLCETLRDVFEDEGYHVGVANNGADALVLMRGLDEKPCIIILDLLMPVMDGNQFYTALKSDPRLGDVPVVITTSDPTHAPDGVITLTKPVSLDRLLDTVKKCC